jgi:predicted kinase
VEAVILVGLQGAGKSSFYRERLFASHLRISLDLLRTCHRERRPLGLCIETGLGSVVDNTNPTSAERRVYINAVKEAGFGVIGYYFRSRVEGCIRRNVRHTDGQVVTLKDLLGTAGRMELPADEEGCDVLHYFGIGESGGFVVEGWRDEDR